MTAIKGAPLLLVLAGGLVWFAALYGQSFGPGPGAIYVLVQAIGLVVLGVGVFRQIDAWDDAG